MSVYKTRAVRFNGILLNDHFKIANIVRPFPEFKVATTGVDGADGESFDNITFGMREVEMELLVRGTNSIQLQDAARKLMRLLSVSKPKPLKIGDEDDGSGYQLTRYAVPSGQFDFDDFMRAGRFHVKFLQPDPFLYGKERSVTLAAGTGKTVKVGGNAPAYPTAKATATGDHYTFRIVDGPYVKVTATSLGGTEITVDCEAQRFTSSKSTVKAGLAAGSRFFPIEGTVRLAATRKTVVTWTERWL